jgi:two-component system, OmpR family, sensor kinase
MALRDRIGARLSLRIYLVGLAQIAVIAAGFHAIITSNRPDGPGPREGHARYIAADVARALGDPRALDQEIARARSDLHAVVTVVDPDGAVVASTAGPGSPRCDGVGRSASSDEICHAAPLRFPDGREGRIELVTPLRPPPLGFGVIGFVLVVVGVSSWLLGRSLTRPLGRLSAAARAFGGGDLAARAGLRQRDELGDVSRAFDEMAERVTGLLRAEKELLANVSHELRTPLARIRVALDLASEGDAEVARASLADIAGDLDELERLIADVLTAARLDLGDGSSPGIPPLRRERVDLAELLDLAASRFRSAHPDRALRVDLGADLPVIDGDPALLRCAVDNLLGNAHKYTDRAEEPVELIARSSAAEATIDVIDRGIGISAEDLPRVFRPFFRADKSRTRATGGLGLGLALAKRIVDAHGGRIEITSTPGEGTRARLHLPITLPTSPALR